MQRQMQTVVQRRPANSMAELAIRTGTISRKELPQPRIGPLTGARRFASLTECNPPYIQNILGSPV